MDSICQIRTPAEALSPLALPSKTVPSHLLCHPLPSLIDSWTGGADLGQWVSRFLLGPTRVTRAEKTPGNPPTLTETLPKANRTRLLPCLHTGGAFFPPIDEIFSNFAQFCRDVNLFETSLNPPQCPIHLFELPSIKANLDHQHHPRHGMSQAPAQPGLEVAMEEKCQHAPWHNPMPKDQI